MSSMKDIDDFLSQKRIAVVGVSRQPNDFSRMLFREFLTRGYDAVPVNPIAPVIDGQRCFARVQDISPPVTGVLVMTSPDATDTIVRDCAVAKVPRVWMYRAAGKGAVSNQAVEFCRSNGMSVIPGECPYMFLPGGAWIHRAHGFVRKIAGTFPN